ncbi:HsdR family type I site-specific deoxyribonuclease [Nicoliella spurrieriana]|uniref:Type I restriction enzyme endonuclease subunit n=1 Tax=Nicoliella spurrieriana TaxID=2925830 RepID=A0A976RS62_9LACO|nr:HsdR family type I site-specific deoxyribonuclease [Nicoliella spurrieriana]UQS86900.1 HsdR family type I site-specific deoxyribonuclease [Nicoliella spurrieriana]
MTVENDELKFEQKVYDYLANLGGSKQWQQMDAIKTTADLWDNFRKIVYQLNQDKLTKPLSDAEFNQVKAAILNQTKTPYYAGVFLYGVGGKSQVEIDRDDNKHVYLTIFDQDEIGAGNTVYQIVRQIERKNVVKGKHNRRFDVTLLINGLPIIQIEEKSDKINAKKALEQMRQYADENQYSDIFSTVQILIAMTPHEVRYMANTTSEDFNTDFAFEWKQNGGRKLPIQDWKEFADQFLSIPMAHRMATNYMILDNTPNHQSIKVMRYYQVYATQEIIRKLSKHDFDDLTDGNKKVGYIWHTTGSGKTISSFKAAFLASRLPNVDKVVFLVDRIALTNQTAREYKAYDPNSDADNKGGIVSDTANVGDLRRKLKSKNKTDIVVTSIQKLHMLVSNDKFSMDTKRTVFIVDEAHRSTSGDMLQKIKKSFRKSAWIGYTGTPNFDQKNGPTTKQIFGLPLHRYVISDAIADKNVLGFKVDFQTTIPYSELKSKYLPQYFHEQYPNWTDTDIQHRINSLTNEDMDDAVKSSVYDMQPNHVEQVVADILKYWDNRSVNGLYNAMLTTHVSGKNASTPMAMMYYDEFQKQMTAKNKPLKIAITFSQNTSNDDNQLKNNQDLFRVISDYNQQFNTNFDDTTVNEYFDDVCSRLNRTVDDKNYLDLVIVVNQLLTGFDAPNLNTLYVDRTLKGANLIQAYSRTNRIQDMEHKPYGHIVNYRWPMHNEKLMRQALAIYSNPDSADSGIDLIPDDDKILAKNYEEVKSDFSKVVDSLSYLTGSFTAAPNSEKEQRETYNQLNRYNRILTKLKQYSEFVDEGGDKVLQAAGLPPDDEARLTGAIAYDVKKSIANVEKVDPIELDMRMEHVKEVTVNYDYLHELIAEYANHVHDNDVDQSELDKIKNEILRMLDSVDETDQKYARQVRNLIDSDFAKQVKYPLKPDEIEDLIKNSGRNWSQGEISAFIQQWGLENANVQQAIEELIDQHQLEKDDLQHSDKLEKVVNLGKSAYKQDATDQSVKKLSKIKYYNQMKEAFKSLADKIKKQF